jgi:hypothetical protein
MHRSPACISLQQEHTMLKARKTPSNTPAHDAKPRDA